MANSRLREKLMIFAENENKDLLLPRQNYLLIMQQ